MQLVRSPEQWIAEGLARHRAGDLDGAERCYAAARVLQPSHGDALNLLAIVAQQRGDHAAAETLARSAVASRRDRVEYYNTLGNALAARARYAEAIDTLRRGIRLNGRIPELHLSLGIAQRQAGDLERARASIERALALHADTAEGWFHLGRVHQEAGARDLAVAAYERAISLAPGNADVLVNLAGVLGELRRDDAACERAAQAVAAAEDRLETWLCEALVLARAGRLDAATTRLDEAAARWPDAAELHVRRGAILNLHGRHGEAMAPLARAIEIRPTDAYATLQLAEAHGQVGEPETAYRLCREAVAAAPSDAAFLQYAALYAVYVEESTAAVTAAQAACAAVVTPPRASPRVSTRTPRDRVRIAFLSPDFRRHSVRHFIAPLLRFLDRAWFEVACYYSYPVADASTARLRALADRWTDCFAMSDEALAAHLRDAGIDVLVDLAGYTAHGRLSVLGRRPAALQLAYLGYPVTTASAHVDARVSDALADPDVPGAQAPERVARLPGSYFCYEADEMLPALRDRAPGHAPLTFGSFNNLAKLSGTTLDLWADVLAAVPESVLMLKAKALADAQARARVTERFAVRGVRADRLRLEPWRESTDDHLAAYRDVDIALDTFPYNGATTTCEALLMGVPVVSRHGDTSASRMGLSILAASNLPVAAVGQSRAYVEDALRWAADAEARRAFRATARERLASAPLTDGPALARAFGALVVAELEAVSRG